MVRDLGMTPLFTRLTDLIAVLAVITWIDNAILVWIQQISETAALVTPIFALVWLVTQMIIRVVEFMRREEDESNEE